MSRCFFGVLGAKSPYALRNEEATSGGRSLLHDSSHNANDDFFFGNPTSSVGPIAGGIVGCFMFLVRALTFESSCLIVSFEKLLF